MAGETEWVAPDDPYILGVAPNSWVGRVSQKSFSKNILGVYDCLEPAFNQQSKQITFLNELI